RIEAEQRALELDKTYVPAIADLSNQYSARGQLTLARLLLIEALKHDSEPLLVAELARLDINEGHGSAAFERMKALRTQTLSRAASQMLAENYAQLGFTKEAHALANRGDLVSNWIGASQAIFPLTAQAADQSASGTETGEDAAEAEADVAGIPDSESEHLRHVLHQGKEQP